jgi:tetratricopeptide (TPR) repeat protein
MRAADWRGALDHLDRADSLQRDSAAAVFLGTVAAKRAVVLEAQGDLDGATREARRGLVIWPDNFDSRYVLASVAFTGGRLTEAEAQLDTLLAAAPEDRGAAELRERVRAARVAPRSADRR